MADKAPKFARTPLSDPSDLPGAWHLLAGRFQHGLPALDGWSIRCLAPVGRPVSTWFASIRRRSARCLAPVGARRFSLVCQHWAAVYPVPGTCWPAGFSLVCQHWTAVCPVPGTRWPGGFQPALPALDGWSIRCLAPVGPAWFASIDRRSARCLAPLAGRFLPGLPALDGGLSGARHLLAGRFQHGLPALGGGLPGAWHLLAQPGCTCWPSLVCQH